MAYIPVQWIAVGPRQHSRSWYRTPSALTTILLFFPVFYMFQNEAFSSGRGGVWLLLLNLPILGSDPAGYFSQSLSLSLTAHSNVVKLLPRRLWKPKVHYLESPPLDPFLSQINLFHSRAATSMNFTRSVQVRCCYFRALGVAISFQNNS
jgi:hypothetical protein